MSAGDPEAFLWDNWFELEITRMMQIGANFLNGAWRAKGIWPKKGERSVTMPRVKVVIVLGEIK